MPKGVASFCFQFGSLVSCAAMKAGELIIHKDIPILCASTVTEQFYAKKRPLLD